MKLIIKNSKFIINNIYFGNSMIYIVFLLYLFIMLNLKYCFLIFFNKIKIILNINNIYINLMIKNRNFKLSKLLILAVLFTNFRITEEEIETYNCYSKIEVH